MRRVKMRKIDDTDDEQLLHAPILGDDDGVSGVGDAPTPLLASLAGHAAPDASGRRHATWDVSHLGLRTLQPSRRATRFVKLPESFTELYARLRDARGLGGDDVDHGEGGQRQAFFSRGGSSLPE